MGKVLLREQHTCYNHPHRKTTTRCDRCGVVFCDECLLTREQLRFCARCALRQPMADYPPSRSSVLVTLLIIALVAGVGGYLGSRFAQVALEPEEASRLARAATGTLQTGEGLNTVEALVGGKVVAATSERAQGDHLAKRLIDGWASAEVPDWRSADARFPQEIVFAVGENVIKLTKGPYANKVTLQVSDQSPPETWVKDFRVLISDTSPSGPWQEAGTFRLQPSTVRQHFDFETALAKYVKLVIVSNYGSTEYTSLAEFGLYLSP